MPTIPDQLHRSVGLRRRSYVPGAPAEAFIVPLLRERIERSLADFGRNLVGRECALDVGCGRQPFRRHLEEAGYTYRSLDAEQNPEETVDHLAPIDGTLPEKLLAQAPFELVLCTEVLEHVADWHTAFANLRKLTADGGSVVITCPQFYMLHEEPYDFWRPTDYALRYFAERYGFHVASLERLGGPREVLGTMLGFCTFKPRGPGFFRYIIARTLNVPKRLALWYLHSRLSQKGPAILTGNIYLSNFAVLVASGPNQSTP